MGGFDSFSRLIFWGISRRGFATSLLAAGLGCSLISIAAAADLPARVAPPPPVPVVAVFNWTGVYMGINAGYVWARDDVTWTTNGLGIAQPIATAATGTINANGFTAGGQVGWNYQINQLVFGIEADLNYTDLKGARSSVPGAPFVNAMRSTYESLWLGTVRARLGYATGQALFYVTGGLAIAEVEFGDSLGIAAPFSTNGSNGIRYGWTAGGGVEWALTQNWSVKAEYLFVDLGGANYSNLCTGAGVCTTGVTLDHDAHQHIARIGINYRFPGTLFAARY
jgi:outer membrane immunogenic protein